MIGHGSPNPSLSRFALFARSLVFWGVGVALASGAAGLSTAVAEPPTMRVRVAWGGGAERPWHGTIAVSQGVLSELSPLGIEADEPGSIWLADNRVEIRQRSPRAYDGADLLVSAPLDARLVIDLTPADAIGRGERIELPLGDLVAAYHNRQLDDRGNRLLVRRAPGDALRVDFPQHKSLVFSPGETLQFNLEPNLLGVSPGTKVRLDIALGGGRSTWSDRHDLTVPGEGELPGVLPIELKLPEAEGVYELVLTATQRSLPRTLPKTLPKRLALLPTLAERRVQLIVVGQARSMQPAAGANQPGPSYVVAEIDPAKPRWWEPYAQLPQWSRLQNTWKGPLGNGDAKPWQHPLGQLVQLGPGGQAPNISWEAYALPINHPGEPHVLEVEYPTDVPQTLGISIVEPNAAGAVTPIGLDSGIYVADDAVAGKAHWAKHRVVFWPRTRTPLVLVTNRREGSHAVFGKIRVLGSPPSPVLALPRTTAVATGLPRAFAATDVPERLLAGYLDRPLFPENFSATESLDSWSGRSLDDWFTFYQGGTRLVEYLNHVGYNGLMVSVLADGSTIYPSAVVQPTPRYDTGVFFATGQDPVQKDSLEMLFRLFNREGLKLIPAVQFSAPLPELEAILRRGGSESVGIEWTGSDGATWLAGHAARRGLAPYYNPLHPRVQEAMLRVVRELAQRYATHPSFVGLAVQLSADGYAQLPGDDWGFDDDTVAHFESDTGVRVPAEGPGRFAARAKLLLGPHNSRWLEWRAAKLAEFHRRIQAEVAAARPGAFLFLAGANLFDRPEIQRQLQPALPRTIALDEVLLRLGIDPALYVNPEGIVFLRPQRIAPMHTLASQAVNLEVNQSPELERQFRGMPLPGSLFFHEPQEARLPSFDAKSPFRNTYSMLVTEPVPSGERNRQRFVHSLAMLDSQAVFDGGWLLPLGQEEAMREFVSVYRRLPAGRFETVQGASAAANAPATQPVTIRRLDRDGQTYVYLANDFPYAAEVNMTVTAPAGCRLRELGTSGRVNPLRESDGRTTWTVQLRPYDLLAAVFSSANVKLSEPRVFVGNEARLALETKTRDLTARVVALPNPPPLGVLENPGFDQPSDGARIPAWTTTEPVGSSAHVDAGEKHAGGQSLRLSTDGPAVSVASAPFAPPKSGRLSLAVWLKVSDETRQPPLQLRIDGKLSGKEYFRYALVGAGSDKRVSSQWAWYVFPVNDLPADGLSQLRVRFDLVGPGEVWIDDVQLYDLIFTRDERMELSKIAYLSSKKLQDGQLGDCVRLLEGYWPRFLAANVPLSPEALARKPEPDRRPPREPEKTPGMMDRLKGFVPSRFR
ncbi:MAG: family 10 glycosylhydrolase [Pirellulales bacterium]